MIVFYVSSPLTCSKIKHFKQRKCLGLLRFEETVAFYASALLGFVRFAKGCKDIGQQDLRVNTSHRDLWIVGPVRWKFGQEKVVGVALGPVSLRSRPCASYKLG